MRAIVLADLDDTLFQSRRRCPDGVPESRLRPLAFDQEGRPLGFATPRQAALVGWISKDACLVPVTARSRAGLERVSLSWRYAICAHGAVILEEGRPWSDWEARMSEAAAAWRSDLDGIQAKLARIGGAGLRITIVAEPSPLFLVAKHRQRDEAALAGAAAALAGELPDGWRLSVNGNNLAVLPPYVRKEAAVAALLPRLRREWPDAPVIGLGDSNSDAAFLRLCDFAAMPTASQLAATALANAA